MSGFERNVNTVEALEVVGYAWVCPWCITANVTRQGSIARCTECEEVVFIAKVIKK